MEKLKRKIEEKNRVLSGDILNVTDFLNHMVDANLMRDAAKEFCRLFAGEGITKILTVEGAGVALAAMTAEELHVPMLFAKKFKRGIAAEQAYHTPVTAEGEYEIGVSREYLTANDRVLVLDDCLANGDTLVALLRLAAKAGAAVVGAGIVIEKVFQSGGKRLRESGLRVESLVKIAAMSHESGIIFA